MHTPSVKGSIHTYIHKYTCVDICTYIYIYMLVCIYTHMHVHTYEQT